MAIRVISYILVISAVIIDLFIALSFLPGLNLSIIGIDFTNNTLSQSTFVNNTIGFDGLVNSRPVQDLTQLQVSFWQ